jgi:hypothetical protein
MTNRGYLYGTNYTMPGPSEPEPVHLRGYNLGGHRNNYGVGLYPGEQSRSGKMHAETIEQLQQLNQNLRKGSWYNCFYFVAGFVVAVIQSKK